MGFSFLRVVDSWPETPEHARYSALIAFVIGGQICT